MQHGDREDIAYRFAVSDGNEVNHAAGHDPQAVVGVLETLQALEASEPTKFETWWMIHPVTSDRLARVTAEVAGFPELANPVRDAAARAQIKAQLPRWGAGGRPATGSSSPKRPAPVGREPGDEAIEV